VQVALLNNENAETLVTDPRVAFFSFIGSAKVGWSLKSKLAPGTVKLAGLIITGQPLAIAGITWCIAKFNG
jgi:acyl-CoA reductase-like NAD-dependent aldehyde dehydrogenase